MLILAAIARRERCLPVTNGDGKKTVGFFVIIIACFRGGKMRSEVLALLGHRREPIGLIGNILLTCNFSDSIQSMSHQHTPSGASRQRHDGILALLHPAYSILCTQYAVLCILYSVFCILYSVYVPLKLRVQRTLTLQEMTQKSRNMTVGQRLKG